MGAEDELSLDVLIKGELDGKATAVARYDEMLWKIRTGYTVLLYGATGIVAGLVNQKAITLNQATAWSVIVLVIGFSVFGALLDYSFMAAKLRVVNYRDRLVALAHKKAISGPFEASDHVELLECLKNSGERKEHVDWSRRIGLSTPLIYYGGTGLFCTIATLLLAR